jgi:hypothetical protein
MTLRFPAPYEGQEADRDRDNFDALALLVATGEYFEVIYRDGKWSVRIRAGSHYYSGDWHVEDTLPSAALRAVLALKEARDD